MSGLTWSRRTLLVALVVVGCAGESTVPPPRLVGAGQPGPRRGGVLRFSVIEDVRNLDPAIAFDELSMYVEHMLFDTLVGYPPASDPDPTRLVPQLAERWSVSADGLVYSFTLRPGVTFSDGQPVVAEDFVYALERVLDPATGSPGAQFYLGIAGAADRMAGKADRTAGLRALDERRLQIRLEKPDASFPLLLAMKFATPQKRGHVEAVGPRIRDTPLGTGPFRLVSWKQGESLTVTRNERYWDPALPYLDGIELQLMVPRDVAVLKFLRGELDTVERLPGDEYLRFVRTPAWQPYILRRPGMNVQGELLDVTRPPFDDKRVRQAMNYAIDKDDTVKLMNGRGMVAHSMLPPLMPGYDPDLPPYPHDPEKARRLLAEAGYPNGFAIAYTTMKDELGEKTAQSLQADLAEVGIRVRIEYLTFPAYLTAVGRHELQFAYTGWYMDFPDPWNFLEVKFHSRMIAPENSPNDTGYANPEVDRLLDEARVEPDRERRMALYRRVDAILHDDCPWVWQYHSFTTEVRQPYVMGYLPHPVWHRSYRETWLDDPRREAPR